MSNPVYIPIVFFVGIILTLFLKKSENLSIGALFLIFIFSGIFPLYEFWQFFFHHKGYGVGHFFNLPLQFLLLDGERSILLGIINLTGAFSVFYLISFFRNKWKFLFYLLFFLSVNLLILSTSVFLSIFSITSAFASLMGLFFDSLTSTGKKNILLLFFTSFTLLLIGLICLFFLEGTFKFSEYPDIVNFFFFSGLFVLLGTFPFTAILKEETFSLRGIFLILYYGVFSSVSLFLFYSLSSAITNLSVFNAFAIIGTTTYFFASFMATGINSVTRIVSYNAMAQFGLMIAIIGLSRYLGIDGFFILSGIFLTHFFAKTGILWLFTNINKDNIEDWHLIRKKTASLFLFGVFIFALAGFPPFPSFFARWKFVARLIDYQMYRWIILFGLIFLMEAYYLFRWLSKIPGKKNFLNPSLSQANLLAPIFSFIFLLIIGNFFLLYLNFAGDLRIYFLFLVFCIFLLSFTPPLLQFILSLSLIFYTFTVIPLNSVFLTYFGIVFLFFLILLIPNLRQHKYRQGLNANVLLIVMSAIIVTITTKWLSLFFWALLFVGSIFIYALHKKRLQHKALLFLLLSVTGIFAMAFGIQIAVSQFETTDISYIFNNTSLFMSGYQFNLIIAGIVILLAALAIIFIQALRNKSKTVSGYFTFQNILAIKIDDISAHSFSIIIQVLLFAAFFGVLVFSNIFQ